MSWSKLVSNKSAVRVWKTRLIAGMKHLLSGYSEAPFGYSKAPFGFTSKLSSGILNWDVILIYVRTKHSAIEVRAQNKNIEIPYIMHYLTKSVRILEK